jgi:MarR family transcriptional regulator, organic hydroperoxide resistance regulator
MDSALVSRLANALNRIYRKLDLYKDENMQIDPKEQLFLLLVEESGPCRLKDLAARVNLPLSTVSWTADRMVEKGFLTRRESPDDRRAVILDLDRRGRKQVEKYHSIFLNLAGAAATQLTEEQYRAFLGVIESLAKEE